MTSGQWLCTSNCTKTNMVASRLHCLYELFALKLTKKRGCSAVWEETEGELTGEYLVNVFIYCQSQHGLKKENVSDWMWNSESRLSIIMRHKGWRQSDPDWNRASVICVPVSAAAALWLFTVLVAAVIYHCSDVQIHISQRLWLPEQGWKDLLLQMCFWRGREQGKGQMRAQSHKVSQDQEPGIKNAFMLPHLCFPCIEKLWQMVYSA